MVGELSLVGNRKCHVVFPNFCLLLLFGSEFGFLLY